MIEVRNSEGTRSGFEENEGDREKKRSMFWGERRQNLIEIEGNN